MNEPEIPEIDASIYRTPGMLMVELLTGEIRVPVWIKFRCIRHKITEENKQGVCKGLLIAIEFDNRAAEAEA